MDRSRIADAVGAHPLVRRVLPALEGEVSAVGGVVRDCLIGRPHGDELDLVVEGDAVAAASNLGRALGARVVTHPRFGSAHIELPHGGHVDLVGARTESYRAPGVLPSVAPGTLDEDLGRRDFTVNAMALRLTGARRGDLVDPHGGASDLAAHVLRALRPEAFVEDPSRLVRAARYASRLDLVLDPRTAEEARALAPRLDPGSSRVAEELRRALVEGEASGTLERLRAFGVPWVRRDAPAAIAALERAASSPGAPAVVRWALRMGAAVEEDVLDRVAVPGWARAIAREVQQGAGLASLLLASDAPSQVDRLLRRAPPATAIGALAAGASGVAQWWTSAREPSVTGADLVRAGIVPGPAIGYALVEVRAALLDGRVATHDEQLALAIARARSRS